VILAFQLAAEAAVAYHSALADFANTAFAAMGAPLVSSELLSLGFSRLPVYLLLKFRQAFVHPSCPSNFLAVLTPIEVIRKIISDENANLFVVFPCLSLVVPPTEAEALASEAKLGVGRLTDTA
jgi:hypothetical protein